MLRPGETAQDKVRELSKSDLHKNLIISTLVAAGAAAALLYLEYTLASVGLMWYSLPEKYPYLSHGIPLFLAFFYVGWASYWGIRNSLNAALMDQRLGVNQVVGGMGGVLGFAARVMRWAGGGHVIGLLAYGVVALRGITIFVYSLLGGGIYGFYNLTRQSTK